MKTNASKKLYNIASGTTICGKWNKRSYKIIRKLGEGANGVVYLAEYDKQLVACKLSENYGSIASEMNILKSFSKVQGSSLGPYLIDADDWKMGLDTVAFYVMEYIKGKDLLTFIKEYGEDWIEVLMLQLLTNLAELHQKGWVFCDLKPENLIVTVPSFKIRCVDVGGITLIGRSVKEYTEFFDRGYWELGSRRAEPSYDLFAVAMIFINAYYPQRFSKRTNSLNELMNAIEKKKELKKYKEVLQNALKGKYKSATEMRSALLLLSRVKEEQNKHTVQSKHIASKKKKSRLGETVFIFIIVCFLYGVYFYTQIIG